MKRIALLLSLFAGGALAQSLTNVTASAVYDFNGGVMAAGRMCFVPSTPLTAQGTGTPVTSACADISFGGVVGTLQVPNLATASPLGASYAITLSNTSGVLVLSVPGITAVSGTTYSFDLLKVPATSTANGTGTPLHVGCADGAAFIQLDAVDPVRRWSCVSGGWQNAKQRIVPQQGTVIVNGGTVGNYLTNLTGDVYASGPGSAAATLATVNVLPGACGDATHVCSFTTDSKGRVITQSSVSITGVGGGTWGGITGNITNQSDLIALFAGKQAVGNYVTALTGDITASGPGSAAATLATVNASPGTCGDASHVCAVTVDGKGRMTSQAATSISVAHGAISDWASATSGFSGAGTSMPTATAANQVPISTAAGTTYTPTTVYTPANGCGITWSGTSSLAPSINHPFRSVGAGTDGITPADCEGVIKFTAGSAGTPNNEVLPQPGLSGNWVTGGFTVRSVNYAINIWATNATIDGTTYTSGSPLVVTAGKSCYIFSDSSNWQLGHCN